MIHKLVLFSVCVFCMLSCKKQIEISKENNSQEENHERMEYLNTFSNFLPDYMFDQGAWFGIKLSEHQIGIDTALLLSDSLGYKSKQPLFELEVKQNDQKIIFDIKNQFLPGRLIQESKSTDLTITLQSIYTNHQTALLAYTLSNTSNAPIVIDLNQKVLGATVEHQIIKHKLSNAALEFTFDHNVSTTSITIPANQSITQHIAIRHRFDEDVPFSEFSFEKEALEFKKNEERWYGYLKPYQSLTAKKQLLAAKCIQTLVNNWRSASGLYKHDGVFPSYYYSYFNGFWAWDSWRHAVALSTFEPELAKNQVRAMYDFQDEQGMIADAVWRDPKIYKPNLRNTKPPLSGWAIHTIFKADNDISFVKEMFPKLVKYHQWWYKNRDHNDNKLCEYGSTDGTREAAAWESGMDNAVRFDTAKMIKNNANAWSLDQESIDLNAYLYGEKEYLVALGSVLGKIAFVDSTKNEIKQLKNEILNKFYDEEDGYLYDYNFKSNRKIKVKGPEAWAPLWFKIPTQEQAENVIKIITDTTHFNTHCPFPTLDASHPKFNPQKGYWRGPVWLDQAYIAINGMKNYGFETEAEAMKEKLLNNAEGLLEKNQAVWENYDPRNGKPLNAKHFSWSSSHLLLLLHDEITAAN